MEIQHEPTADSTAAFMAAFTMSGSLLVAHPPVEAARERVRAPFADHTGDRPEGDDT